MPEDMEVPTEHLHESIHEQAEKESWILVVALSAALLAVLAAVSSLLAGHHANEALMEQVQAADQWAYYQSKGIKAAVLEGKMELLSALDKTPGAADEERVKQYHDQQKEIEEKAREMEHSSSEHLVLLQLNDYTVIFPLSLPDGGKVCPNSLSVGSSPLNGGSWMRS